MGEARGTGSECMSTGSQPSDECRLYLQLCLVASAAVRLPIQNAERRGWLFYISQELLKKGDRVLRYRAGFPSKAPFRTFRRFCPQPRLLRNLCAFAVQNSPTSPGEGGNPFRVSFTFALFLGIALQINKRRPPAIPPETCAPECTHPSRPTNSGRSTHRKLRVRRKWCYCGRTPAKGR
jgi:hypothetical protein